MSGAICDYLAQDVMPEQSQVADEIENLVAHEFVGKAQRTIPDAGIGKHNRIFFRRAADQPHVAQFTFVSQKTECASWGNVALVSVAGEIEIENLQANGTRKIDGVRNRITIGGIHTQEFIAFA